MVSIQYIKHAYLVFILFALPLSPTFAAMMRLDGFSSADYLKSIIILDQQFPLSTSHDEILALLKGNNYTAVVEKAADLVGKDPDDIRAHLLLALGWLGNDEEKKLHQHLKELDAFSKDVSALVRFNLGRYYAKNKRLYKALEMIKNISNKQFYLQTLKLRAEIYTFQERTLDAIELYMKLYDVTPTDKNTLLNLARLSMLNNHQADAKKYAEELLGLYPTTISAAVILGTANMMVGDIPAAQAAYQSITLKNPVSQMGMGHIALIRGNFQAAFSYYHGVLAQFPLMIEALQGRAIAQIAMGEFDAALGSLKQANKVSSFDPLTHLIKAACLAEIGRDGAVDESLKRTEALFYDINKSEPHVYAAFIVEIKESGLNLSISNYLYRQGYFKLVDEFIKKQGLDAKLPSLLLLTKARALSKNKEDNKALTLYQALINRNPNMLAPILEKADIYFRLNNLEQVQKGYEQAVSLRPGIPDLHLRLGNLYNHLNYPKLAVRQYEKILQTNKKTYRAIALGNIATTLLEKEDNPEEALEYAVKARGLAPKNKQFSLLVGTIYMATKEYRKALVIFNKLNDTNGLTQPIDYYRFGVLLTKENKKKKAMKAFEMALNFGRPFQGLDEAEHYLR